MGADGSRPKQLTFSTQHLDLPSFSADGRKIAYSDGPDSYVMRANGKGKATNLTARLPHGGFGAVFSPDGTKVAVTSYDGGDSDIFLIDADGSNPVNLTAGSDAGEAWPDFSPDGSRIAFTTLRNDDDGDLWVMNADGTGEYPVAAKADVVEDQPSFSPDGKQIAYTSQRGPHKAYGIFIVSSAGGKPRKLAHTGNAENPSWGVSSGRRKGN